MAVARGAEVVEKGVAAVAKGAVEGLQEVETLEGGGGGGGCEGGAGPWVAGGGGAAGVGDVSEIVVDTLLYVMLPAMAICPACRLMTSPTTLTTPDPAALVVRAMLLSPTVL